MYCFAIIAEAFINCVSLCALCATICACTDFAEKLLVKKKERHFSICLVIHVMLPIIHLNYAGFCKKENYRMMLKLHIFALL